MTKAELIEIIRHSEQDDWETITCWGWGSGPSYLDRLGIWTSGETWRLDIESHALRAVYKPDLSLGIAYGLIVGDGKPLDFDWAKFPDEQVTASFVDVLWNGMLVHRDQVLHVDGGRAILPWPRPWGTTEPGSRTPIAIGNQVTATELALARLVHGFEHAPAQFDSYLERSGFVIDPDDPDSPTPPRRQSRDW